MVDDVEAFSKVDKAQDRDFAVIHSTQCTVRNVQQSRLGGDGSESESFRRAVPGGEKMQFSNVKREIS